jgi:hypothetical protein
VYVERVNLRDITLPFALLLSACATTPPAEQHYHAVLGYAVEPVREAAVAVVTEVAHPKSLVRVTDEGSVLTEGWIGDCGREVACAGTIGYQGNPSSHGTPWATIEVRFRDLGTGTAAAVEVAFEDCDPNVDCQPQRLASTGALERQILAGIRERLESVEEDTPAGL